MELYWSNLCTFHSLQRNFQNLCKESEENVNDKNHIIKYSLFYSEYVMKIVIFKERSFSDTHFMNSLKKVIFKMKMSKKLWIPKQIFPKMTNIKEHFFAFFAFFSFQRIFLAKISLFAIQYISIKISNFLPYCLLTTRPIISLGAN